MSQVQCPNGHLSADPEWCDTCGARLGAAPAAEPASGGSGAEPAGTPLSTPPSGAPVATADSVSCPHCGAANTADALFCEDCGYDFTTGQAPDPVPTGTVPVVTGASAPPTASSASSPAAPAADPSRPAPAPGPPGWIVIVEIDPKWYELKGTLADQPLPQPSSSTIPLALAIVHIGRSSHSRGIHPEIAMDSDTAVSRQHAQLVATASSGETGAEPDSYGVVDLGSTNGTFVVKAGLEPDAYVEPIAPGTPVPLADGDRIYIGAWSRLTIRNTQGG